MRSFGRLASAMLGWLGGGIFSAVVLAWVADRARGVEGEVVVHIAADDLEVDVGGCFHRVTERPYRPIVCYLPAGEHVFMVKRGGRALQCERFSVPRGGSVVLTAWEKQPAEPSGQ